MNKTNNKEDIKLMTKRINESVRRNVEKFPERFSRNIQEVKYFQ